MGKELPNMLHFVSDDILISSNKRHLFGQGSSDKQAIKGITVNK